MSLIRARRRRKSNWMDTREGMPRRRLVAYLFMVILAIWYLGWAF
jgi:hypothetical protein